MGQTEQIYDDLNPDFKTRFLLNYYYEQTQNLKIEVFDADGAGTFDQIGQVITTMSKIMEIKNAVWSGKLTLPNKTADRGTIYIRGEKVRESNTSARFQMRWENLNNRVPAFMGTCFRIVPVRFEISRATPGGNNGFCMIYRSPLVKDS